MYGLRITVFTPGTGGVPSTIVFPFDLSGIVASIEYSITDQGGFESATLTVPGVTPAEYARWAGVLGAKVLITGRDGRSAWEGRLTTVEATLGQEHVSRSLDGMANHVYARYTTVNGVPAVGGAGFDSTSIARYGTHKLAISLPAATSSEAQTYANLTLAERKYPQSRVEASVALGNLGATDLTLTCTGWYYALDDLLTSNSLTSTVDNVELAGDLIGLYTVTNDYFSTTTAGVASGLAISQYTDPDTTFRAAIEHALGFGDGTNPFRWGVYEDETLHIDAWAGATPSTIHYIRTLGDGLLYTPTGARVEPWNVRPNTMRELADLRDLTPASGEVNTAARSYVARVRFTANESGMGVTLEPSESDALSARLARIESGQWT